MAKQFHEYSEVKQIPAGEIERHPTHQRKSPLHRFEKKLGTFDIGKCVELIHVVKAPTGDKWLAVDGATRVEACLSNKKYGPDTMLDCKIYGNGTPPRGSELDELFLLLNADHIAVGSEVKFTRAVGAKRPAAVSADKIIKRLGSSCKGRAGVWRLVERFGARRVNSAVDFIFEVWGCDEMIPMNVFRAITVALSNPEDSKRLHSRRKTIARYSPETWRLKAQAKHLSQMGKRDDVTTWTARVLLGLTRGSNLDRRS